MFIPSFQWLNYSEVGGGTNSTLVIGQSGQCYTKTIVMKIGLSTPIH